MIQRKQRVVLTPVSNMGTAIRTTTLTAKQLRPDTPCSRLILQSKSDNTDVIYIGTDIAQYLELMPGSSIELHVENLDLIYYKSDVAGQSLIYLSM